MDLLKLILRILKGAEAIQTGPLQTLRVGLTSHKSLSSKAWALQYSVTFRESVRLHLESLKYAHMLVVPADSEEAEVEAQP